MQRLQWRSSHEWRASRGGQLGQVEQVEPLVEPLEELREAIVLEEDDGEQGVWAQGVGVGDGDALVAEGR